MIPKKTLSKIEEFRLKGWFFDLRGDKTGWDCYVVGTGLAYGKYCSPRIEEAVERALAQATAMVDDPQVVIKAHGTKIEALVKEFFGKDSFLGLDAVEWEPEEPRRLCIRVKGSDNFAVAESRFYGKAFDCLPREVIVCLTFEIDWPDEAKS